MAWKCTKHSYAQTVADRQPCPLCGAEQPTVKLPPLSVKKEPSLGTTETKVVPKTEPLFVPLVHPTIAPVEPERPILLLFNSKGGRGAASALGISSELLFEIGDADIMVDKPLAERLKRATTFSRWNKKVVIYGHSTYAGQVISDNHRCREGKDIGLFLEANIYQHVGPTAEANVTVLCCYIGNQTNPDNHFLDDMAAVFKGLGRPYHLKGSRRMVSIDYETLANGKKAEHATQIKFLGTLHSQHRDIWPKKNKYDDVERTPTSRYTMRPAGSQKEDHAKYPRAAETRRLDKLAVFRYVSSRTSPQTD